MKRKSKICKICGNEFYPFNSLQQVCGYKCALIFNKPEEIEKRFNQIKEDAQPIQFYEDTARKAFQLFIRMRDKDLPCISCGTFNTKQWDGGHFFKAELYSGLIFDELNCNKQCCYCNGPKMHGNLIGYRIGLVKKIGEEKVKELELSADEKRIYKYDKFELLQIKKHYQSKIKQLKKQL